MPVKDIRHEFPPLEQALVWLKANGGGYSEVILNHIADIELANACFRHADETGDDHLRDATEMMGE